MTSTKRQQRDLAVPVIAATAIRTPAIQQSNCCCLWEHQFRIRFSGCNLIVKASEVETGNLAGMPGRRGLFVCESLNLQIPAAALLPSVFFFLQEMYSHSMSKMRSMDNQPVLKSQRFILSCRANLRKLESQRKHSPPFCPFHGCSCRTGPWTAGCALICLITDSASKLQAWVVCWNSRPLIQGSWKCCASAESQPVCTPRAPGEHKPVRVSSTNKALGCAEPEQSL